MLIFRLCVKRTSTGKDHKGNDILKLQTAPCPFCGNAMIYCEFLFQLSTETTGSETDKLVMIEQIQNMIEKVKNKEKLSFSSFLLGCYQHYRGVPKEVLAKQVQKPYIMLDAEDIFYLNNTDISKVYIAVK